MVLESHGGAREKIYLSKNKLLFIILECSRYSGTLGYIPEFTSSCKPRLTLLAKFGKWERKTSVKPFSRILIDKLYIFNGTVDGPTVDLVTSIREHKSF